MQNAETIDDFYCKEFLIVLKLVLPAGAMNTGFLQVTLESLLICKSAEGACRSFGLIA